MLRNIPSATLKQLVRLSERKESLMAQIQEIDRRIAAGAETIRNSSTPKRRGRTGSRFFSSAQTTTALIRNYLANNARA